MFIILLFLKVEAGNELAGAVKDADSGDCTMSGVANTLDCYFFLFLFTKTDS